MKNTSLIKFSETVTWRKSLPEFSCHQKCKISKELIGNINLPAGSWILVNKKVVGKFYYLEENFSSSQCLLDDYVKIKPTTSDVNVLEEIELIKNTVEFEVMEIELVIDSDFKVLKFHDQLEELVLSLLRQYVFCKDCAIRCENKLGINQIVIRKTIPEGFGSCKRDGTSKVTVKGIFLHSEFYRELRPLGGLESIYRKLQQLIDTNRKFKDSPENFQVKPPCQALLIGPSGTGKSSIVRQLAAANSCSIIEIQSEIFKPYPGETEAELERIFVNVKKFNHMTDNLIILLFENIEVFCPKFDEKIKENSHTMRICSQICNLLDDISLNTSGIFVMATTSRIESLNVSVRRVNRLECEILFDMPDLNTRTEIMMILLQDLIEEPSIPALSQFIAERTPGFVGADLEVLCQTLIRKSLINEFSLKSLPLSALENLFEESLKQVFPSVLRESMGMVTRSNMKLNSIVGMESLKKSLLTAVLGPLRNPEKFRKFGLQPPKGILLYGPSGCAKTTIAKCLAGETQMTLIAVSSAEIYSPYVGESEKFIVRLFNKARMSAPAILFFDEIDSIVGNRTMAGSGSSSDVNTRVLSTLLTEIDGIGSSNGGKNEKTVIVIGATNRPNCIDDALMRPGRFDKLIHIPAPDRESRMNILKSLSGRMPFEDDVDLEDLAERTHNFSGADLFNLCNEAALNAATRNLESSIITREDFEEVLIYLRPSLSEKNLEYFENFEKLHRGK